MPENECHKAHCLYKTVSLLPIIIDQSYCFRIPQPTFAVIKSCLRFDAHETHKHTVSNNLTSPVSGQPTCDSSPTCRIALSAAPKKGAADKEGLQMQKECEI